MEKEMISTHIKKNITILSAATLLLLRGRSHRLLQTNGSLNFNLFTTLGSFDF